MSVSPCHLSGNGRTALASSSNRGAFTLSSPLRVVITVPCTPTQLPRLRSLNASNGSSPMTALDTNNCTSSSRSRIVAKTSLPESRWSMMRPATANPIRQLVTILPAQARHETGEIEVPPEAQSGDYDLVVLASPTWWFQTSMPMRSYLESPGAKAVMSGKPFACASVSRRYFRFNLGQQRTLGEKNGGRWIDQTHFVSAGGQVKSMLAWLGYMKHGEPQARVFGLTMYPPNLKSDFEEQANAFADGLADGVLRRPVAAGAGE